jgi:hypothetical protein
LQGFGETDSWNQTQPSPYQSPSIDCIAALSRSKPLLVSAHLVVPVESWLLDLPSESTVASLFPGFRGWILEDTQESGPPWNSGLRGECLAALRLLQAFSTAVLELGTRKQKTETPRWVFLALIEK